MTPPTKEQARTLEAKRRRLVEAPPAAIDLSGLTNDQLVTLRTRIETELVGRWKL